MNKHQAAIQTGGRFIVEPIGTGPIFTREQFSEEHLEIERMVREFARENIYPNQERIEAQDKDFIHQLLRQAGQLGLLSIDAPEKYGGLDLDKITSAIVIESLAAGHSSSFTATFSVQTAIGSLPIVWFGTPEQKAKYLPKLISGEWIGAYGLTEPTSGSDALAAKTTATLSEDGKYYLLNGEKQFITNGGWANVYTIFAKINGEQFSAFIVERDTPGLEVGSEEKKLGMKGSSTTSLRFTDARVPVENLLYEAGKGAIIAFNALNLGRFKLAAADLGGSKETITEVVKYALQRRQFGQPIAAFDVIKGKMADMVIQTYAADAMIYRTIGHIQEEIDTLDKSAPDYYLKVGEAMEDYAIEASMAKVFGSEITGQVVDHGLQIFGGYGFMEEFPLARGYRDARIDRIWEGTNEINRQIIVGYMMKKALLEELPIREAIRGIETFLEKDPYQQSDDPLTPEIRAIETGKRLALYVFHEALCAYGQDLKHHQQLIEIIANMFINLYTAESTLLRVKQLEPQTHIPICITRAHTAEVAIHLLSLALTGLNGIYKGHLPEAVIDRLRTFQIPLLLPTDIIGLKRQIADYLYTQKQYPF
ncbi:MAG: acyl-CoA dehydrogenase family protein [Fidelibacterota bacterium]